MDAAFIFGGFLFFGFLLIGGIYAGIAFIEHHVAVVAECKAIRAAVAKRDSEAEQVGIYSFEVRPTWPES